MRYTGFFPDSRFPIPDSRLPIPCSLKPTTLYLTEFKTAVSIRLTADS
ncbi:MAG: hypothetical protein F6J94_32840 [Moorea sp. SIO1F2]|nr:hypothetical protein [Moorena sp. SIO1F2]NET86464.1 hypothetical protein [Moorena sp. SIO1F2]